MLNALSFDIEEWYHAELVRKRVAPENSVSQVEQATEPILNLLARRSLRATFFIVGDVMEEHPDLVRSIVAAGHEVGCHTMSHRPLWLLTPEEFRIELEEWRAAWTSLWAGQTQIVLTPTGFRAPTFSVVPRTAWALDVLAQSGFQYDSSIFPVANYMYGLNGGPLAVYRPAIHDLRRDDAAGPVVEFPMTVWQVARQRLPVAGGFYLRALPAPVLKRALREVSQARPVVLYMHPWETFAGTPAVPGLSMVDRFITYYNRSSALAKLESLLDDLAWAPLRDVLAPHLDSAVAAKVAP